MAGCAGSSSQPRWGILGLGGISNDFCCSLATLGSNIAAVGARDETRAKVFAEKFGAKRAYGSYEDVVNDPEVDVVYVGSIHTMHAPHVRLALQAGKHVLCEKPMAVNEADVQSLVDLAREKKLFLMEAVWTRFFPAIEKARAILESGELGVPRGLQANFGFMAPADNTHRLWDANQAGGAMLDIGIYLVQLATLVFGPTVPQQIACSGQLSSTGVDKEGAVALTWTDKGTASLLMSFVSNLPGYATIVCSQGNIHIHGPFHCPSKITVSKPRGDREQDRGKFVEETFEFPYPKCPEGRNIVYPNGEGMLYEAQAVENAVRQGFQESPAMTLDESLVIVRIMDEYRKQVGVVYPCEK